MTCGALARGTDGSIVRSVEERCLLGSIALRRGVEGSGPVRIVAVAARLSIAVAGHDLGRVRALWLDVGGCIRIHRGQGVGALLQCHWRNCTRAGAVNSCQGPARGSTGLPSTMAARATAVARPTVTVTRTVLSWSL